MSIAIPPMLYGIGKERWGAPTGAVAAAGYVVVPIAVGFSNFWNLETICIFGALLFFWGHSRHITDGRNRYLVASLVGLAFACAGDWVGYLLVAPTLGWALLARLRLPGAHDAAPRRRVLRPVVGALGHSRRRVAGLVGRALSPRRPDRRMAQRRRRARGRGLDERSARRSTRRKAWIDFSFTPLAICDREGRGAGVPASSPRHSPRRGDVLARAPLRSRGPVRRLQGGGRRPHLLAALLRGVLRAGARAARRHRRGRGGARGAMVLEVARAGRRCGDGARARPDAGRRDGPRRGEGALGLAAHGRPLRRQRIAASAARSICSTCSARS